MSIFRCWNPELGHEPDDGRLIHARDAEGAACEYVRRNFDRWEYPSYCDISVAECGSDKKWDVEVEMHPEPCFVGRAKKASP